MNIADYIQQGIGQPRRLTLDLSIPLANQQFSISGTQFGVWAAPLQTDEIQVRFNQNQAVQIPFQRGRVLAVPFNKVFITVPAGGAGNMDILYGHGSMDLFRIFPNAFDVDLTAVLTSTLNELQGDIADEGYGETAVGLAFVQVIAANADRKGCSIQAKWDNGGGIIYVGYDNTVAANNWAYNFAASEGHDWDDYRGPIYAIGSIAALNVGWGEW